jgi:flagellar basal-body rod protein FlgB
LAAIYLDQLSAQRTQWLNLRQSVTASNVANANTPNYLAKDIAPFSSVLAETQLVMASDQPGHIQPTEADYAPPTPEANDGANATLNGNSVNLEQEMMKIGDIGRDAGAVNAIKRIYHQMMLTVLK